MTNYTDPKLNLFPPHLAAIEIKADRPLTRDTLNAP